jgi:hypothetical protein
MTDTFELGPRQLAHMRELSDAILAAKPWLRGPYRVPVPAPVPAVVVKPAPMADLATPEAPNSRRQTPCYEWLRRRLPVGVASAKILIAEATALGFSDRNLRTARKSLKIRVKQTDSGWVWIAGGG